MDWRRTFTECGKRTHWSGLEFYKKTPEALNAVRGPIYEDKVVDYIIKNCSVSEKKVDSEELFTEVVKENENKKVNKNKEKKTKPLKTSEWNFS